jgi:predicted deacylase
MKNPVKLLGILLLIAQSIAAVLVSTPGVAADDVIPSDFSKIDISTAADHTPSGDTASDAAMTQDASELQSNQVSPSDEALPADVSTQQEPVSLPAPLETSAASAPDTEAQSSNIDDSAAKIKTPDTNNKAQEFHILNSLVAPATIKRLQWSPDGLDTPTPVWVINGKRPGKTLCMTAAIHGDELNGVEIVRRIMQDINPKKLSGRIVGVPIVNLKGFQRGSRYLPDRRDLNRSFPGVKKGSLSARIAYSLYHDVISHCSTLIDLHTGSLRRDNLLQVRADMRNPDVVNFTHGFDKTVVVHSPGNSGMLRRVAVKHGIPAVTLEAGESSRLQSEKIDQAVQSIFSLLQREGMYSRIFSWGEPEPIYFQSRWLRADIGGILLSQVELGADVKAGEVLGTVSDPTTNEVSEIVTSVDGRIIGMAVDQVVMPGFAIYHLGIEALPKNCVKLDREIKSTDAAYDNKTAQADKVSTEAGEGNETANGMKTVPTFSCPTD